MIKLFDNISPKNMEKLFKLFETHTLHFKKNSSIYSLIKGDNCIGYILSGYIQIIKIDDNGNKTIIEEILEENIFNTTISSLNNSEYDIIAKEDTNLLLIDYQRVLSINDITKDYYLQFIKNLLKITIDKTEEKNERIAILTKKTIRNKLLEYFNIAASKHGSKFIYLPFNFIDLADYLAVDRSAISRELRNLKEEGFIEIKGKRITLLYDRFGNSDKLINF